MGGFRIADGAAGSPFAWWLLSRFVFPFQLARLDPVAVRRVVGTPGPWNRAEIALVIVLCGALAGWIGMPRLHCAPASASWLNRSR